MSDVIGAIQRPEWWFSTILVAVIANVAANFIYDAIKPVVAGRWLKIAEFTYATLMLSTLIACSFLIPMPSQARVTVVSACVLGFGSSLLDLIGFTVGLSSKYFFLQLITTVSVLSLIFFDPEFSLAWKSTDVTWFAKQVFAALFMSIGISGLFAFIFMRERVRKTK